MPEPPRPQASQGDGPAGRAWGERSAPPGGTQDMGGPWTATARDLGIRERDGADTRRRPGELLPRSSAEHTGESKGRSQRAGLPLKSPRPRTRAVGRTTWTCRCPFSGLETGVWSEAPQLITTRPTQRRPSASRREETMTAVRADEDRLPRACSEVRLGVGWAAKPSDGRAF